MSGSRQPFDWMGESGIQKCPGREVRLQLGHGQASLGGDQARMYKQYSGQSWRLDGVRPDQFHDANIYQSSKSRCTHSGRVLRPKFTPPALGPILFEDVGDDFFRNRRLRCEKQVIDNSIVAVPHWQRVGNEFKPIDSFEALLKRLHDRRVVLFDKFPLEKKVALVAFDISSFTP